MSKKNNIKFLSFSNDILLFIILVLVVTLMGIRAPRILSLENLFDILRNSSFIGICSIGFLIVLISGGIDISFTATATMAQYLMALLLVQNKELSFVVIIFVPIAVGAALGTVNAWLIHTLKAPAIIVTIGTFNAFYGLVQMISAGRWLYDFPDWFKSFSKINLLQLKNSAGTTYGLSIFTVIWFGTAVIGSVILNRTVLGRKIFAIGGNLDAARRAGVNIFKTRVFCYGFLGVVSGIAAIVHAMSTQTVAPNAIINQNFDVLAAVVIGGADIMGGAGTVVGSILGVLLIAFIKNGLTIMHIPMYWHQVIVGAILLISVALSAIRFKKSYSRGGTIFVK